MIFPIWNLIKSLKNKGYGETMHIKAKRGKKLLICIYTLIKVIINQKIIRIIRIFHCSIFIFKYSDNFLRR